MDFQVSVPGPFTYLVHEHARSIVAIQELQREVTSLLEFRDHVLHALPHLQSRGYHSLTPTAHEASSPAQGTHHHHHHHAHPHASRGDAPPQGKAPPHGAAGRQPPASSGNSSSSSSSSSGGKSLSETHSSAVADSGFSTDKAGGSMGKSSSSSAGEHLSGVGAEDTRWTSVEPELPLGSAEDELWHLLDVIQRKGSRLRNELERAAERAEREGAQAPHQPTSSASDPPPASPRPHPAYRDLWPHSLPGPLGAYPSRGDFLPPPPPPVAMGGLGGEAEAWAAVDRLRQDRQYLAGRVSWAEAEAAASHHRLLDLHDQLVALAGDKRRLEEQVRALRIDPRVDPRVDARNDLNLQFVKTNGVRRDGPASTGGIVHSVMGGVNTVHIVTDNATSTTTTSSPSTATMASKRRLPPSVTVSVTGDADEAQAAPGASGRGPRMFRSASSVRINGERDVVLPRVLKVPIKDRSQRQSSKDKEGGKEQVVASRDPAAKELSSDVVTLKKGSDRVVIERERRAGRADGGLSMPVSLLKGAKIKVQPNKQRISAILREKDVLELQRQLLTTVMETEVLKKQIETASEEWVTKTAEWETDQRQNHATIMALRQENLGLKAKVEERAKLEHKDASISAHPLVHSIATMTEDDAESVEAATHTVHPGPNIKYDVVIHQEDARHAETNNNTVSSSTSESVGRKAPPAVEKPPRRSREARVASSVGSWNSHHTNTSVASHRDSVSSETSGGRESIGRAAGLRSRATLTSGRSTPTATPRSSPAPSISARTPASRATLQEGARASPLGRSSSSAAASSRGAVGRRDSLKTPQGTVNSSGKSSNGAGGQHKNSSVFVGVKGGDPQPGSVAKRGEAAISSLGSSSLESCGPPLTLSDLRTPTPVSSPSSSASPKHLFVLPEERETPSGVGKVREAARKRLSASDLYNRDDDSGDGRRWVNSASALTEEKSGDVSTLRMSNLRSGSDSASPASSGSFYDSINSDIDDATASSSRLMQVEVAFDWNPLPTQEIRYLPPAAHMWTSTHTLSPDKRLPGVGSRRTLGVAASERVSPAGGRRASLTSHRTPQGGPVRQTESSETVDASSLSGPTDSLEDSEGGFESPGARVRAKRRPANGALRLKSIDRPSVLALVHAEGAKDTSAPQAPSAIRSSVLGAAATGGRAQDSRGRAATSRVSQLRARSPRSSVTGQDGGPTGQSSSELNARVHQILARIAASAQ